VSEINRGTRCNKDGIWDDSFHIFLLRIVPMIDNLIVSDRAPSAARLKEDFPEMFSEKKGGKKEKKKKKGGEKKKP